MVRGQTFYCLLQLARLAEPTYIIKHVTAVIGVRNCDVTTMSIRQHRNMLVEEDAVC